MEEPVLTKSTCSHATAWTGTLEIYAKVNANVSAITNHKPEDMCFVFSERGRMLE